MPAPTPKPAPPIAPPIAEFFSESVSNLSRPAPGPLIRLSITCPAWIPKSMISMNAAPPSAYLPADKAIFAICRSTAFRISVRITLAVPTNEGISGAPNSDAASATIVAKNIRAIAISMIFPFWMSAAVSPQAEQNCRACSAASWSSPILVVSQSLVRSAVTPRIASGNRGSSASISSARWPRSSPNAFQALAISRRPCSLPSGQVIPQVTLKNFCSDSGS
ncbi:hypothetical protein [Amycolatopsis sp. PS_44_ISF1]|uniref:hypothetical protein n=1 Tax=Amycolatopsis sp. PS_44_ISF1 TaxID=2974917 RepID=UPI0028DEE70A|nr:hypothetical protein [Amycolatopsis sp. PS_44_ISF1]MDT8912078.1 hypothetical protein [Amycolatopsis sp. PS_44_ISF1]